MPAIAPFQGLTLETRDVAGVTLSENHYPALSHLPRHGHERAFLSLTLAGGYVERHHARSVDYGNSSIAFHPPDGEHSVAIGSHDVRCLNVEVRDEWLERVVEAGGRRPEFVRAVGGPLVWLARRLHEESRDWSRSSPLAVEGLVLEMLTVLGQASLPGSDRTPPRWLDEVEEILRHEFTTTLTVDGLARRLGLHPVHLSRTWRRFRRSSLGDAVRRLRVDEARLRVTAGREPLVEIALDVGFADQAQFTRAFRRVTGVTPRAYRRGR